MNARKSVHPLTFIKFKAKDIKLKRNGNIRYDVVNTSYYISNAHKRFKTTYYGKKRAKWDMYNCLGYICSRDTLLECKEHILERHTHWIIERQHGL